MPMSVSDIGQTLLALDSEVTRTELQPLVSAHGQQWSVLTVAAGASWSAVDAPCLPLSMLVLEGHATCSDTSGRQSIGSGHVVILDEQAPPTLTNETMSPFRAVLTWSQAPATGEEK